MSIDWQGHWKNRKSIGKYEGKVAKNHLGDLFKRNLSRTCRNCTHMRRYSDYDGKTQTMTRGAICAITELETEKENTCKEYKRV